MCIRDRYKSDPNKKQKMADWHKGNTRAKKIDVKLRLRQMIVDIDELFEYLELDENNIQNVDPSEIRILIEGVRAVMDLVVDIKNK